MNKLNRKLPFVLKFKFIFLMYWCVMGLEFGLMMIENFPKPKINETATVTTTEAYFKAIFGKLSVVDRKTYQQYQKWQALSITLVWAGLIVILVCMPCVFYCRCLFIRKKVQAIGEFCLVDKNLIQKLLQQRVDFLSEHRTCIYENEKVEVTKLLSLNKRKILKTLCHPNLIMDSWMPESIPFTNLQRLMFADIPWIYGLGYIVITRYMKDVIRAVQYLHEHNIYHLNIQPVNILILSTSMNERGSYAKLGNFDYARKSEGETVATYRVGLKESYRPPECLNNNEVVDVVKFEVWSIGVTAFDAFTGGMFTVMANSNGRQDCSFVELLQSEKLLNQSFFVSALDAAWELFDSINRMQVTLSEYTTMYDLDAMEFAPDCWNFVRGLLQLDPKLRFNLNDALETNLMQKLSDPGEKRKRKQLRILEV